MKKIILSLLVLTIVVMGGAFPKSSEAYASTAQTAVRLNDDTFLFTVTYRFAYLGYELLMPIGTKRESVYGMAAPKIGYDIQNADGTTFTTGETYSIVLSDSQVAGTNYFVPNSKSAYFTLVTILKLPTDYIDTLETGSSIHMKASTVPFTLSKPGRVIEGQLDENQLQTYTTPEITLK